LRTSEDGSLVVRPAAPEDAVRIARIHAGTWQGAYGHVFPADRLERLSETEERRAQYWQESIERAAPRTHTLVAGAGEGMVGFASLGPAREDDSIGELYAIYVLPEAWGRGIGRALMSEVVDRLRDEGFAEAVLWVLEENPRTRRFYELAGWRFDGGAQEETFLDTPTRTVRYRIEL
jgi:GNAT superfamily N-acetyltransferase